MMQVAAPPEAVAAASAPPMHTLPVGATHISNIVAMACQGDAGTPGCRNSFDLPPDKAQQDNAQPDDESTTVRRTMHNGTMHNRTMHNGDEQFTETLTWPTTDCRRSRPAATPPRSGCSMQRRAGTGTPEARCTVKIHRAKNPRNAMTPELQE